MLQKVVLLTTIFLTHLKSEQMQEFTNTYRIEEQYMLRDGRQMVERRVFVDDDLIASEYANSHRESGDVCLIVAQIKALQSHMSDERSKCFFKIDNDTKQLGNAIYMLVRLVFRLKLLKFKFEALKFDKRSVFDKCKTAAVKQV